MQSDYYHSPCPVMEPIQENPSKRRSTRKRGKVLLALSLSLIVLLSAGLIILQIFVPGSRQSVLEQILGQFSSFSVVGEMPEFFGNGQPGFFPDMIPTPTAPASASKPTVSIPRAQPAPDVSMTISSKPSTPMSYRDIYYKVLPSIVSIEAYSSTNGSSGTGVIMTDDGYIITNHHIISGCSSAEIVLHNKERYEAKLVGSDVESDLAVLKIDATNLTPAEFGSSDLLEVGDISLAIGNPLGSELFGTLTEGIISAIDRDVHVDGFTMSLIQTTAALNPGNSGGALINPYGQVVGITNMKMMSTYETIEGLGFAIPTIWAKEVVDTLLSQGVITGRPTIGITCYTTTQLQSGHDGVQISTVTPGGPADLAGLRPGDIIIAANGETILTLEDLTRVRDKVNVDGTLELTVWRFEEIIETSLILVEQHELNS